MVTCRSRPPSAKYKERLLGRLGTGPGRSKFVTERLRQGTEDVRSPSPVPQILWEPERKSHRLSKPHFRHLSNGGNVTGLSSPKSYLEGNVPGQPRLPVGHPRSES